jgi:hypothetical protein
LEDVEVCKEQEVHLSACSQFNFPWPSANGFHGKTAPIFKNLAFFSQNSINTNRVEHNLVCSNLGTKVIALAVKLASKFFKKMDDHIDDDSFPKAVPAFARNLFSEQLPVNIIAMKGKSGIDELKQPGEQNKVDGNESHCKKQ